MTDDLENLPIFGRPKVLVDIFHPGCHWLTLCSSSARSKVDRSQMPAVTLLVAINKAELEGPIPVEEFMLMLRALTDNLIRNAETAIRGGQPNEGEIHEVASIPKDN
jgi:hypothetical protein